jgi:hypothetical protein
LTNENSSIIQDKAPEPNQTQTSTSLPSATSNLTPDSLDKINLTNQNFTTVQDTTDEPNKTSAETQTSISLPSATSNLNPDSLDKMNLTNQNLTTDEPNKTSVETQTLPLLASTTSNSTSDSPDKIDVTSENFSTVQNTTDTLNDTEGNGTPNHESLGSVNVTRQNSSTDVLNQTLTSPPPNTETPTQTNIIETPRAPFALSNGTSNATDSEQLSSGTATGNESEELASPRPRNDVKSIAASPIATVFSPFKEPPTASAKPTFSGIRKHDRTREEQPPKPVGDARNPKAKNPATAVTQSKHDVKKESPRSKKSQNRGFGQLPPNIRGILSRLEAKPTPTAEVDSLGSGTLLTTAVILVILLTAFAYFKCRSRIQNGQNIDPDELIPFKTAVQAQQDDLAKLGFSKL